MEVETLFSDSKWRILTELSHKPLSPSELAKRTGTSMANISTQIRLLEALGFVEKQRLSNIAKDKPRKRYSLKKQFAYMILATNLTAGKKLFSLDNDSLFFFNVWLINDQYAPYVLIKLYSQFNLENVNAIGYLGIRGHELEIVVIDDKPESLHYLNEKQITFKDKTYKIKAYVHKPNEFVNGVKHKEEYFTSIIKKVFIVSDKDNVLTKLKKGVE